LYERVLRIFGFVIFLGKENSTEVARIMLVKLATVVNFTIPMAQSAAQLNSIGPKFVFAKFLEVY